MLRASHLKLCLFCGILFVTFSLLGPAAQADLIDQTYGLGAGSFELGGYVDVGPTGYMRLAPGSTTVTGWTVSGPGDGVDWLNENPTFNNFNAYTGTKSVDLRHLTASSIGTTIPTVPGTVYELSFAAAAVTEAGNNTGLVSAGSLVDQPFTAGLSNTFSSQTFSPFTFFFTATGAETTILFKATGPTASSIYSYGPAIDSVGVNAVNSVAEPATILLFGFGLIGLLKARRKLTR